MSMVKTLMLMFIFTVSNLETDVIIYLPIIIDSSLLINYELAIRDELIYNSIISSIIIFF